ncbi:MAG: response regulator [Pseudomonadota bacterium]
MQNDKPHILFVDDEIKVLTSLKRSLHFKSNEWDMEFTTDIDEALAIASSNSPDVVVSDLRMPEMSGIEMILKMRGLKTRQPTFILLTGNGDMASAIDAINEAQVFRFLTKPCPADELVSMIEDAIDDARSRVEADASGGADIAEAALALLSPAIVITDDSGRVSYMNQSATEILSERDGLFLDNGGIIRALKPEVSKGIHDAIVIASGGDMEPAKFFRIPRPTELKDLTLVILPGADGRAVLFLTDPQRSTVISPESLSSLFDLTRAEASIAYTLSNGGTIEDAAKTSGITVSSARTYLKRVFYKTGVGRQSDLVQLILTTPAPLIRSSIDERVA